MGRSWIKILALSGLCLVGPGEVWAQQYPSRPVKVIVPIAAGGPLDTMARVLAEKLSEGLKQPFIVENQPGAGGNMGGKIAATAPPDGYTLLVAFASIVTVNPFLYKNSGYNPAHALRPISILATSNSLLVVHPSIPVNSVTEFVAFARNQPLTYAHSGVGSPAHLAMEFFRQQAGFETIPVPYRGAAPLVTDLISGQIKVGFIATAGVINYVNDGKLRGLGISTPKRSKFAPNIPTMVESGYPKYTVETPYMLFTSAGTPEPMIKILERETYKAMQSPDVEERLNAHKTQVVGSTSEEASALIKSEIELWGSVIKAANIEAN